MDDVVLVTADSVRHDFVDSMPFVSSHNPIKGIAAGHYTRPSLASLLSSSLLGSIQSKVIRPSLAETLQRAGYTTIGLVPSAQADPAFDFHVGFDHFDNFTQSSGNPLKNRRSRLRELLGQFEIVRDIYHRFVPMEAILSGLPSDNEILEEAVSQFNGAEPPRFLWIHLMGTHRPYGTGNEALPRSIDRKAEASGRNSALFSRSVDPDEHETIKSAYRSSLGRADDRIRRLICELESDPIFIFTSDHGEELGEEGYYYHQGYRRRVVDTITEVPVVVNGIELPDVDRISLLDIAPTIVGCADVNVPEKWHGTDLRNGSTEEALTIAPWHGKATFAWQDGSNKIVAKDAQITFQRGEEQVGVERADVTSDLEERLRELGYMDAG